MNPQDFRSIQEAYMEVVENQQLDEISAGTALSASKKASEVAGQLATLGGRPEDVVKKRDQAKRLYNLQAKKRTTRVTLPKEDVDIYDIILSHLLDEGYADTNASAIAIMANMSEEWRESIVEAWEPITSQRQAKIDRKKEGVRKKEDIAQYQRKPLDVQKQYTRGKALEFRKKMSDIGMNR